MEEERGVGGKGCSRERIEKKRVGEERGRIN